MHTGHHIRQTAFQGFPDHLSASSFFPIHHSMLDVRCSMFIFFSKLPTVHQHKNNLALMGIGSYRPEAEFKTPRFFLFPTSTFRLPISKCLFPRFCPLLLLLFFFFSFGFN
jgi:hypothetical protein